MARLRHFAIVVKDLDESAAFYQKVFGLERVGEEHLEFGSGVYLSDGEVNLALLKYRSDAAAGVADSANFVGAHHFGFQVDDLDEVRNLIEANGGTFHFDLGDDETKVNFERKFKDPDGIIFDISQTGWLGTPGGVSDIIPPPRNKNSADNSAMQEPKGGSPTMALTTQSVLERIDQIHKEKPMYGHPLWTGMVENTFNLDQVRYLCKQHGGIPLHNQKYHGRLYVICPDPEWRELIAEVVYEESTGRIFSDGVSHHTLYLNYAKALGLGREEMYDPPYCGGVVAFQAYFEMICAKTFLEGVSSHMLAGEAAIPGLYGRIAGQLRKTFALDEKGVKYWTVHDTADAEHSDVGRRLLDQFATSQEDRQLVLKTVQQTIDIMHLMYDDIYRGVLELADKSAVE